MRVACSGAGINLRTAAPTPEQLRAAVHTLLHTAGYRERTLALAAEYAHYDALAPAVETIEDLIAR